MAKKGNGQVLNFVAWITGVLVSLSVGFAMAGPSAGVVRTLTLPWWLGGDLLAMIVGWVVVITTLVSAALAILNR